MFLRGSRALPHYGLLLNLMHVSFDMVRAFRDNPRVVFFDFNAMAIVHDK
ncbi:MAG: hypothetical protein PWP51_802 [Clostridiales bacterium]|jgi:hypothetical protein|nr:hypothetical protein [Clostridiales bacterium]MDN5298249.1 hypothetical protein [Clostridiales bacterium]